MLKLAKLLTVVSILTFSLGTYAQDNAYSGIKFFEVKKDLWVYGLDQPLEITEEVEKVEGHPEISEAYPEELIHALDRLDEAKI
jgi:hypothetical protein